MPALFGCVGYPSGDMTSLVGSFESIWGECEVYSFQEGVLGAHAFRGKTALHEINQDSHMAVDGEHSLYMNAKAYAEHGDPVLFSINKNGEIEPGVDCKGNIAVLDQKKKCLYLITEWMGTFPLYYAETPGAIAFSSHLKPLAGLTKAEPDPVGVIQFMRYGYILANRTQFTGIKRLMPGQAIIYQIETHQLTVVETSRLWVDHVTGHDIGELVELFWNCLQKATRRCTLNEEKLALMSSAGWDSRVLFAAIRSQISSADFLGYVHGDIHSRELEITRSIFKDSKLPCHLEDLNNSMFDLDELSYGFDRVENIIFPHWHLAGMKLKKMGFGSVAAGLVGEVIGGHFNFNIDVSNKSKMRFFASNFLGKFGFPQDSATKDISFVYDFLRKNEFDRPWYIDIDFWATIPDILEQINMDIKYTLDRIRSRGVNTSDQLIEAYWAGFRSRHAVAQVLSCRANLDMFHIFADRELLLLSTQIRFEDKIYNSFDKLLLKTYAPELLRYPTAAVLVSAGAPIPVQEVSRFARKISESVRLKMSNFLRSEVKTRHLGWDNFEFLRDGDVIQDIIACIKNPMVNQGALQNFLDKIRRFELKVPLYHVSDQLMKIYTAELMLK
ncbi:MAG: hypothetical protein D3926_05225 [Desulfobacteraceae bacterium]|nr:MAG: hypothetical protein D3926_05225 [Desulfobacteraceae bacterium]